MGEWREGLDRERGRREGIDKDLVIQRQNENESLHAVQLPLFIPV